MPTRKKLARYCGLFVAIVSCAVIIGWVLDIALLKSILPHWVTMKFSTAFTFLLSAALLLSVIEYLHNEGTSAEIMMLFSTMMILLVMTSLLLGIVLSIQTGIENLFVEESTEAVLSVKPGIPSIGTMANFICIGVIGLLTLLKPMRDFFGIRCLSVVVCSIGFVALLGYIFSSPILYFHIEGWSTAMAIHTAILFIALGVGLFAAIPTRSQ